MIEYTAPLAKPRVAIHSAIFDVMQTHFPSLLVIHSERSSGSRDATFAELLSRPRVNSYIMEAIPVPFEQQILNKT